MNKLILKNNLYILLILVLSYIAYNQIINTSFYFSYWGERDYLRSKEMLSMIGLDNWFLGAELSFGGGARIPSGINNIITLLVTSINDSRQGLLLGQLWLNAVLIFIGMGILIINGQKRIAILSAILTILSPLAIYLFKTYWNPGLLIGIVYLYYSILVVGLQRGYTTNKEYLWLNFLIFIGSAFHLSILFLIPSLFMLKVEKKKYVKLFWLILLMPYFLYESMYNDFINTKILLDQLNVTKELIVGLIISTAIVYKYVKKYKIICFIIITLLITFIMSMLFNYTTKQNANDFIYSTDMTVMEALNKERKNYLLNPKVEINKEIEIDNKKIILSIKDYKIEWEVKKQTKLNFNIQNIKGFFYGITGFNGGFISYFYCAIVLLAIINILITYEKNKVLLICFISPLLFYLNIKEINLNENYSRYLSTSFLAIIFGFSSVFHIVRMDMFRIGKMSKLYYLILPIIIIGFSYQIIKQEKGYDYVKRDLPLNAIIFNGKDYESDTQLISDYYYDNSDTNVYDVDTKNCMVFYNEKDSEFNWEIPNVKMSMDKYEIYNDKPKKQVKRTYTRTIVDKVEEKSGNCNSNVQNRYVLSEKDKEMFKFFYSNNLHKKNTLFVKNNNNSYYVNIKDEFCLNDCTSILLNLEFKEDGFYLYSNQLKLKSYNTNFFDSANIKDLKLILRNKTKAETRYINIYENLIGYAGIHTPLKKQMKIDWDNYFIEVDVKIVGRLGEEQNKSIKLYEDFKTNFSNYQYY